MGGGREAVGDDHPVSAAPTLHVLGGGATNGLVEQVRATFEKETGATIDGTFGAVGAMRARLLEGAPADVMLLSRALIEELAREGRVVAESVTDVSRVATSVAVRAGDPAPEVADTAGLRAALLAAGEIHFPDPQQATAGIHFARVLRDLGIHDSVAPRLRTAPNGATAMRALAASTAAHPIGCTQETEIRGTPGVVLVAPLPPGCELVTTYTAAVTTTARLPAEARRLIALAQQQHQ
jgi:molybdate transport system substrate-binding protein